MASPQVENGFTRISNELFNAIMKYPCGGVQKDIILCVIRFTYGYQRKVHELGAGFIANAINRDRRLVAKEIDRLIKDNVLIEVEPYSVSNRRPRKLMLNKNYTGWGNSDLQDTVTYRTQYCDLQIHSNSDLQDTKKEKKEKLKIPSEDVSTVGRERDNAAARIYEHYKQTVRAGAKASAVKSITKLLKAGESEASLMGYINNYRGNGMPKDEQFRIQANNFFGRDARFQDYAEPEKLPKKTNYQRLE